MAKSKVDLRFYENFFVSNLKPLVKSIETFLERRNKTMIIWDIENLDGDTFQLGVFASRKWDRLEVRKRVPGERVHWNKHIIQENFEADELDAGLKQRVLAELKKLLEGPAVENKGHTGGSRINMRDYEGYFTSELKPLVKSIEPIPDKPQHEIVWEIVNPDEDIFQLSVCASKKSGDLEVRKRVAQHGAHWQKYPIQENFEANALDEALKKKILTELKRLVG